MDGVTGTLYLVHQVTLQVPSVWKFYLLYRTRPGQTCSDKRRSFPREKSNKTFFRNVRSMRENTFSDHARSFQDTRTSHPWKSYSWIIRMRSMIFFWIEGFKICGAWTRASVFGWKRRGSSSSLIRMKKRKTIQNIVVFRCFSDISVLHRKWSREFFSRNNENYSMMLQTPGD